MARLRHWIPSALTAGGIGFAAVSVQHSVDGLHRSAAYWVMLCVLTDRFDGAAARALKASSNFGAQLDSFADFFSFGIAPATAFYAFFSSEPSAGWADPLHRALLAALAFFYLLCVAARLARFNITTGAVGAERFFFGIPTTFCGGVLVALFATLIKYGDPAWTAHDKGWDHFMVLGGDTRLDGAMRQFPWLMLVGGLMMVSPFRMPKLRPTRWKVLTAIQGLGAGLGYIAGLTRCLPEYLVFGSFVYMIASVVYHFVSIQSRPDVKLPPLFEDVEERERLAAGGVEIKEAKAG